MRRNQRNRATVITYPQVTNDFLRKIPPARLLVFCLIHNMEINKCFFKREAV